MLIKHQPLEAYFCLLYPSEHGSLCIDRVGGRTYVRITFLCLLNFEQYSIIFPPLLLSYTFDVLDHIRQHNQLNTIRYSLCTMHYVLCTVHYVLCTMHYILCMIFTMHYVLCTMHYALFNIYYAYMHCSLCTMHYALFDIYYALCTALCTIHYSIFTMHYTLCSLFHVEIRRNPVILVLTHSSRRVE